jgi:hypothetical protein
MTAALDVRQFPEAKMLQRSSGGGGSASAGHYIL